VSCNNAAITPRAEVVILMVIHNRDLLQAGQLLHNSVLGQVGLIQAHPALRALSQCVSLHNDLGLWPGPGCSRMPPGPAREPREACGGCLASSAKPLKRPGRLHVFVSG